MSNWANAGENLIADFFRGQGLSALPSDFFVGLASAATDSAFTELSGTGYARQPYTRSLGNWAGTQGSGSVLASIGSSHQTSNNNVIPYGTSGAAWGTANFITIHSALTGGSLLSFHPITPIVIGSGVPVSIAAGLIVCLISSTPGASDYLVNNFIDIWFRAQAFTFPTNGFFALFTTAPSDAGGGVEVNVGDYSRPSIPFSLLGFSGTQSAGSVVASTGTGGVISNNLAISFSQPTAPQGTIVAEGVYDAPIGGNLLWWNSIPSRSILAGSSPQTHAPATWSITIA